MTNGKFKQGQKVFVKCYVYKNGKKCYGVISKVGEITSFVKMNGNNKSTAIGNIWITPIN